MFDVYRIGSAPYIEDLSGAGAKIVGGRWNEKGSSVIYAATSVALAAWEVRVHLPNVAIPKYGTYRLATISILEDDIFDPFPLDMGWNKDQKYTRQVGEKWLSDCRHLCMKVPSAIVEKEFNILINPLHPLAKSHVQLKMVESYHFDHRTFIPLSQIEGMSPEVSEAYTMGALAMMCGRYADCITIYLNFEREIGFDNPQNKLAFYNHIAFCFAALGEKGEQQKYYSLISKTYKEIRSL